MNRAVAAGPRMSRELLAGSAPEVAPALLGCLLTFGEVTLRLTELEAYAGHLDPGSHAFRGETPRTRPMFGSAGFTYVYFTYGHHWCLNLVVGQVGTAEAVLVRAGEVVAGHEIVRARRGGVRERDWCRGPGRLAQALGMSGEHTGRDFCRPAIGEPIELTLSPALVPVEPALVRTGPRVGVSGPGGDGTAYPWRFWLDGEPSVSAYRPGVKRRSAGDGRPR